MTNNLIKLLKFIIWSVLSLITIIPIYWMILVSTRSPVELFESQIFHLHSSKKIYWKNFIKPFVDGVYSEYLWNSIIVASCNAILVTVLAIMATYALSRWKLAASENIFFWTMTNRMAPPAAFLLPLFLLFLWFSYDDINLFDTKIGLFYSIVFLTFHLQFGY